MIGRVRPWRVASRRPRRHAARSPDGAKQEDMAPTCSCMNKTMVNEHQGSFLYLLHSLRHGHLPLFQHERTSGLSPSRVAAATHLIRHHEQPTLCGTRRRALPPAARCSWRHCTHRRAPHTRHVHSPPARPVRRVQASRPPLPARNAPSPPDRAPPDQCPPRYRRVVRTQTPTHHAS